jgi:ATP-dependent helicase/nuclease subunit A
VPQRPLVARMTAAYRLNGALVDERAFYAAACEPQRSVVVEACAGAGKTWMLVSRILRALLDGVPPQQILAITFTRKAAAEMRARLDEWLLAFSSTHSSVARREQELRWRGCSEAQAQALAQPLGALHEEVLRGGRSADVRTFLSWFAQLVAHAPLALLEELGLPAKYDPIEDTEVLQGPLFNRFHRAVLADEALRADYVLLVARYRRSVVLQWLRAAWKRGPELQRADAAGHVDGAVPAAARIWPDCAAWHNPAQALLSGALAAQAAALARQLGAMAQKTPQARAALLQEALQIEDADTALAAAWAALFTKEDEPRKNLGDSPLLHQVLDGLLLLRTQQRQQRAHEDHQAMLRLSRVLLHEYAQLKHQRGLLDMADLERVAEALLGDSDLAGWVQERLDQRVRHILIDEFQDTSPLQWQVLNGWLSSYAGAGGGASGHKPPSVFIVGDPKQSIYRFRGAEPRVFAAARDFLLQGLDGQLLQCDHTRRCAPEVLDAVNHVFEDAARLDDWAAFRQHTSGSAAHGSVCRLAGVARPATVKRGAAAEVWRDSLTQPRDQPELRLRAEEAAQAAHAVAALIAEMGFAPADVMVLARQRASLGWVADALAQRGVPHVVAEALHLHESAEALDLVAVLDVLASPGHDMALARALKSPIFGADDDDLVWLAQRVRSSHGQPGWRQTLLTAEDMPSAALQRAQRLLTAWVALADQSTPHDLLDRIVSDAEVLARLAAAVPPARRAAALHAVNALLAATLGEQGGRFTSLYGFVRALRAGRVKAQAAAPAGAVQLLTVHGAKGLEARAVVVMDSDPAPRPKHDPSLLVDWPVEATAPRSVAFVRNVSAPAFSLQPLCEAEAQAQAREELNGLYVAMTRAREWLVFSRTEPHRAGASRSWWARIDPASEVWLPVDMEAASAAPEPVVTVPMLPPLTWRASAPPVTTEAADSRAARLGQAVHRVLEWAGQPGAGLLPPELPAACQAAAAAFGLATWMTDAPQRVQQVVQRVLNSPQCARFFGGPALRWAGNEITLAPADAEAAADELLRVDRLVLLHDEAAGAAPTWWVLDYKLSSQPAQVMAYQAQMQRYVAAVRALQPQDEVRGAFITGAGELVEV